MSARPASVAGSTSASASHRYWKRASALEGCVQETGQRGLSGAEQPVEEIRQREDQHDKRQPPQATTITCRLSDGQYANKAAGRKVIIRIPKLATQRLTARFRPAKVGIGQAAGQAHDAKCHQVIESGGQ